MLQCFTATELPSLWWAHVHNGNPLHGGRRHLSNVCATLQVGRDVVRACRSCPAQVRWHHACEATTARVPLSPILSELDEQSMDVKRATDCIPLAIRRPGIWRAESAKHSVGPGVRSTARSPHLPGLARCRARQPLVLSPMPVAPVPAGPHAATRGAFR